MPKEKARFYRMARRSAMECVGAVDLLEAKGVLDADQVRESRELLDRILAILTRLIDRHAQPKR